ncbi:hypothetical protein Tco_1438583 [Tanacetum coccineum]
MGEVRLVLGGADLPTLDSLQPYECIGVADFPNLNVIRSWFVSFCWACSHGSETLIPDVSRIPPFVIMLVGADVDAVDDKDFMMTEREAMYKNKERHESVKAASIAATVSISAALPVSLARVADTSQLIILFGITLISCALFGVTFGYVVRRSLDNFQLKTGASAAFGFGKAYGLSERFTVNPRSQIRQHNEELCGATRTKKKLP